MKESSKQLGTVYLVGAGPGHPGLITRLGYDLLQKCDAVAYDALIPMELISGLPEHVEKHYVGKRAGKHSLPQSEINKMLVALARRGLNVVRLKGGDPFIFGRLGEEAEYLAAAGVPVAMVPGVTAASAAAATSGFSLTSRQSSSWVFLATGHPAENSDTPVPWDKIAGLRGGTLVIYMGIASLDRIVDQLLACGMAPETPAVVIQAASTGLQRFVEAPLTQIGEKCRHRQLQPPALIIIGESVGSRKKAVGECAHPLEGKRVLVTSASQNIGRICAPLREAGAEPIPYPTVVHNRFDDREGWDRFSKIVDYGGMCLFLSEVDVRCFFDEMIAHDMDMRSLGRFKIVAVGKPTESALMECGIRADWVLRQLESGDMVESVSRLMLDVFLPLVWPHGSCESYSLEAVLRERCPGIVPLMVHSDSTARWDPHWKDALLAHPPDYIIFTGAAEVAGLVDLIGADVFYDLANRSCVAAIDDWTTAALWEYGIAPKVRPNTSSIEALIEALVGRSQEKVAESAV